MRDIWQSQGLSSGISAFVVFFEHVIKHSGVQKFKISLYIHDCCCQDVVLPREEVTVLLHHPRRNSRHPGQPRQVLRDGDRDLLHGLHQLWLRIPPDSLR